MGPGTSRRPPPRAEQGLGRRRGHGGCAPDRAGAGSPSPRAALQAALRGAAPSTALGTSGASAPGHTSGGGCGLGLAPTPRTADAVSAQGAQPGSPPLPRPRGPGSSLAPLLSVDTAPTASGRPKARPHAGPTRPGRREPAGPRPGATRACAQSSRSAGLTGGSAHTRGGACAGAFRDPPPPLLRASRTSPLSQLVSGLWL